MFTFLHQYPSRLLLAFFITLIAALVLVYYPSLAVPFYLDDRESIYANAAVQSPSLDALLHGPNRMRLIGYISFWANHQLDGLNTLGYHWANIAIHILNTLLVFVLAKHLLAYVNPPNQGQNATENLKWAMLVTLLWAMHPLNSQAVIYIVQRLAAIAAFFYLLTFISYIQLRQSNGMRARLSYGLLLLFSLICGLHAKQNFVSVLLLMLVWELFSAKAVIRQHLLRLMASLVVVLILVGPLFPELWRALDAYTRDVNGPQRAAYFYTQMPVLWDYIARFFSPWSLQLEIDTQLQASLTGLVGLALLAHFVVIALAWRLRHHIPLFFIGIMFFYIAHLVESSIIPIKDLAFEHRTYISNIGLSLATVGLIRYLLAWTKGNWLSKVCALVAVVWLVFAGITIFNRATLWQQPTAFYANEVKLSPSHARANYSYGNQLLIEGKPVEAEKYLAKGFNISLSKGQISATGLTALLMSLYQQDKFQAAAKVTTIGLKYIKYGQPRSTLLSNAAYGYIRMGYCDFALGLLREAVKLHPNNPDAKTNINYCIKKMKKDR